MDGHKLFAGRIPWKCCLFTRGFWMRVCERVLTGGSHLLQPVLTRLDRQEEKEKKKAKEQVSGKGNLPREAKLQ